jgi:hypothetical protein
VTRRADGTGRPPPPRRPDPSTARPTQAGYDDVADLLEQNMREEQETLDELSELGESFDYGELEA